MRNRALKCAFFSLVVMSTSGCGLAQYEQLMAERLVSLRKEAAFDALDRAELISPEHAPWIRIPKHFATGQNFSRVRDPAAEKARPKPKEGDEPEPTVEEQADQNGTPLDFLRELPGFGRMGVRNEQIDRRTLLASYYYLAVIEQPQNKPEAQAKDKGQANESAKMKPAEVRAAAQKAVRAQWPSLNGEWAAVTLETPDGKNLPAHRWMGSGKIPFDRYAAINRNAQTFPGALALYCVEHPAYTVLWGVRVPDAVNETTGLVRLAEAAAGTIELRDPEVDVSDKKQGGSIP